MVMSTQVLRGSRVVVTMAVILAVMVLAVDMVQVPPVRAVVAGHVNMSRSGQGGAGHKQQREHQGDDRSHSGDYTG
jgi:hypothetical protein